MTRLELAELIRMALETDDQLDVKREGSLLTVKHADDKFPLLVKVCRS